MQARKLLPVCSVELVRQAGNSSTCGEVLIVLTRRQVCKAGLASAADICCSLLALNACSRYAWTCIDTKKTIVDLLNHGSSQVSSIAANSLLLLHAGIADAGSSSPHSL